MLEVTNPLGLAQVWHGMASLLRITHQGFALTHRGLTVWTEAGLGEGKH